jgi:hypothetical protein
MELKGRQVLLRTIGAFVKTSRTLSATFHTAGYAIFAGGGLLAILARQFLQMLGRLEQVKLGFEKRDLLGKSADLLSLLAILSRRVGAERIHDSCLR